MKKYMRNMWYLASKQDSDDSAYVIAVTDFLNLPIGMLS